MRVEGFLQFLIDHHHWAKSNASTTNSRAEGYVRGLDSTDEYLFCYFSYFYIFDFSFVFGMSKRVTAIRYVKLMTEQRTKIRTVLNDQVFSMLERWLSVVVKENKLKHACVSSKLTSSSCCNS